MKRRFIILLLAGGILLPSLPASADGLFSSITNNKDESANVTKDLFSSVASVSTEMLAKISDLTDIQKSALKNSINSVLSKRAVGLDDGDTYSSMLSINLSDLNDEELQWLLDALNGKVDVNSLNTDSGPVSESSIGILAQNMSDFDKKNIRNATDCAIYNLKNNLKIESFSSYIAQKLNTTSLSRLEDIKEALPIGKEKKEAFDIADNYIDWFNYLSPTSVIKADDINYKPNAVSSYGKYAHTLSVDDLQIYIDAETDDIQFIMLPLNASSDTKQAFSAIALISSLEFGSLPESDEEKEMVKDTSSIISFNLVNCLSDNASQIVADKKMTFYEDDDYVYQILYLADSLSFKMVISESNN